jgi:hypothetical protein
VEGLELLGIAIIFFVAYLYLPAAIFKLAAERFVDLQPSKDSSELEDFIANAIPSGALHIINVALMWLVRACSPTITRWVLTALNTLHLKNFIYHFFPSLDRPLVLPVFDWKMIGAFITGEEKWYILEHLGDRAGPTAEYFVSIVAVSIVCGRMFGASLYAGINGRDAVAEINARLDTGEVAIEKVNRFLRSRFVRWIRWILNPIIILRALLAIIAFLLVEPLYLGNTMLFKWAFQDEVNPLFPWSQKNPPVFVRTRDRIFMGRFVEYEKERTGDIATITIANAKRYCFDERESRIQRGEVPISDLEGALTIRWSQVVDIDVVAEDHADKLYAKLSNERDRFVASVLVRDHAGKARTLRELVAYYADDSFTEEAIDSALVHLAEAGKVTITSVVGSDLKRIPTTHTYHFPRARRKSTSRTKAREAARTPPATTRDQATT